MKPLILSKHIKRLDITSVNDPTPVFLEQGADIEIRFEFFIFKYFSFKPKNTDDEYIQEAVNIMTNYINDK